MQGALLDAFDRWGYEPVSTPAVELFDVFGRGLTEAERDRCVRFIEPGSGAVVTLRSDVTPQIARLVTQRFAGPLQAGERARLCYAADIVRRGQAEHHQVGVELVGDAGAAADAEIIALCCEALDGLGLGARPDAYVIDLAHVNLAAAVIEEATPDPALREQLRRALARKDEGAISALLRAPAVDASAGTVLRQLCWLHGPPDILNKIASAPLPAVAAAGVDRLRAVVEILAETSPAARARVTVDLGEVRGFDYYSGLRVRVWAHGAARPIARGGRYDGLLRHFGADRPATGLAIDLDALEASLAHAARVEVGVAAPAVMVALAPGIEEIGPKSHVVYGLAADEARRGRELDMRAWVESGLTMDDARALAARRGATELVYLELEPAGEREDEPTNGPHLRRSRWLADGGGWRRAETSVVARKRREAQ